MESVIGEYSTEAAATQAVRALEREHQISIQDLVIANRSRRTWRKLRPGSGRSFSAHANFVVVMRGESEEIARVRALLN